MHNRPIIFKSPLLVISEVVVALAQFTVGSRRTMKLLMMKLISWMENYTANLLFYLLTMI